MLFIYDTKKTFPFEKHLKSETENEGIHKSKSTAVQWN